MWGVEPKRIAAAFAATAAALATMVARADDLPGAYSGHGVAFAYPATWLHAPGEFDYQVSRPLWQEFFGPQPAPPTDPTQPAPAPTALQRDIVAVASYRTNVAITKKNLARYKTAIQVAILQLVLQSHGAILSGPQRVTMGGLPGYRFQVTATVDDNTTVESRLVLVFNKKTEYYLNCQHVQNGQLTAEIESGCDQLMQSFKVSR
jgi:hypothetical protein